MQQSDSAPTVTTPTAQADPMVFELPLRVVADDIDGMNHANNIVYLRWVQEVATAHWYAAATEAQKADYAWVVSRHEVDYLRPALLGDELTARTWVGEVTGARFERHVEIRRDSDGQTLARARSVWVALDARTGRPRRIDPNLRRLSIHALPPSPTEFPTGDSAS